MAEHREYPRAYFITISCYGTWLHGDERGSVDYEHRMYGESRLPTNAVRASTERKSMRFPVFELDESARKVALQAIRTNCHRRNWLLLAAHVRRRHVHVVVTAPLPPEPVTNGIKAYMSKALNGIHPKDRERRRWTRHASMRYLWEPGHVQAAVHYVVYEQGEFMEVYQAFPEPDDSRRYVHGKW